MSLTITVESKSKYWCDWALPVQAFARALGKTRDHITEHGLIEDGPEMVAQIERAVDFLNRCDFVASEAEWNEGWDFIRDHIRGWWD